METLIIIKTTVNNNKTKNKIINNLLKRKLASCINIIKNISSIYLWENRIVKDKEEILLVKTLLKNEKMIYETIKKLHNYTTPEIITLKTFTAETDYLKWLTTTIKSPN